MAVIYTHLTLIFKARTTAAAGGEERLEADETDAETRRGERHWFRRGLSILVVVERSSSGEARALSVLVVVERPLLCCSSSSAAE